MELLLFCDHWAYSSHTRLFIFSVRAIKNYNLCLITSRKPKNQTSYALPRAWGFFSAKIIEKGLGLSMLHDGAFPYIFTEMLQHSITLEISLSNISCHFFFLSLRYTSELPAITNVFLMLWPGVCGQSPHGFVCDELNGLNYFSLLQ